MLRVNAEPQFLFGVNRKGRVVGIELGYLITQVADSSFATCKNSPQACLRELSSNSASITRIRNESPRPSICGTVGFAYQEVLPWAWSWRVNEVVMPSRVALVEVQC
jgi:antimicrobial peptide system SdpA family protein